ncbi:carbonic anhydrase [Setomelanomma holmii]|uniref:Carbonic anhydrase n=1 Tax=Setomelanomma holmii TaxID=210430 RepID=A0A9P4LLP2_9PLEO|nr:carbonic anhydrase [Setomelanomma holmii]
MLFKSIFIAAALVPAVFGCPQHQNAKRSKLRGRQTTPPTEPGANSTQNDWAYEASFNWGRFNYNGSIAGNFYNWGYGPAFTVAHDGDWTTHPSFSYDNKTAYLKGWHIHAPADHSVGGDRSKAELHLVHVDAEGHETAVLAIRLDPGNFDSAFFSQLPEMIGFNSMNVFEPVSLDLTQALQAVQFFNEFWTYQGSLTSPPCREGIRWFVARQILFTGVEQMQDVLGASTYSARAEQEVWQHRINE